MSVRPFNYLPNAVTAVQLEDLPLDAKLGLNNYEMKNQILIFVFKRLINAQH